MAGNILKTGKVITKTAEKITMSAQNGDLLLNATKKIKYATQKELVYGSYIAPKPQQTKNLLVTKVICSDCEKDQGVQIGKTYTFKATQFSRKPKAGGHELKNVKWAYQIDNGEIQEFKKPGRIIGNSVVKKIEIPESLWDNKSLRVYAYLQNPGKKASVECLITNKVLVVFYHGGPMGDGETKTDTSIESSGYTGPAYERTVEFIKNKGMNLRSVLIAPAAVQYFGVKTGKDFIFENYNEGDKIIIYGYSYGGDNAVNLAESIGDIPVDLLIIVDSSDGLGRGLTVDTSISDNVKLAYNFYQTAASGGFSRSKSSDSDNPNTSENSSSDGSSNSMGSRGFPHSTEGKAKVHNIRLTAEKMSHGEIQNLGKDNIQRRINERIETYICP
ncbi:MAG: hypothetical protein N4A45_06960 [Flavobacteriales bacterium]|jgi:hypothetical protein|nr:hypothetical protein [Flavobacteriales bacterium]